MRGHVHAQANGTESTRAREAVHMAAWPQLQPEMKEGSCSKLDMSSGLREAPGLQHAVAAQGVHSSAQAAGTRGRGFRGVGTVLGMLMIMAAY